MKQPAARWEFLSLDIQPAKRSRLVRRTDGDAMKGQEGGSYAGTVYQVATEGSVVALATAARRATVLQDGTIGICTAGEREHSMRTAYVGLKVGIQCPIPVPKHGQPAGPVARGSQVLIVAKRITTSSAIQTQTR